MTTKLKCSDCGKIRDLTTEDRINLNNRKYSTYCYNCGACWTIDDMLLSIVEE